MNDRNIQIGEINAGAQQTYLAEKDLWKRDFYILADAFLRENYLFEGGAICQYCRSQGLREPHHHNVWGAMLLALQSMGWITHNGYVTPKVKHTHRVQIAQWRSMSFNGSALADNPQQGKLI